MSMVKLANLDKLFYSLGKINTPGGNGFKSFLYQPKFNTSIFIKYRKFIFNKIHNITPVILRAIVNHFENEEPVPIHKFMEYLDNIDNSDK